MKKYSKYALPVCAVIALASCSTTKHYTAEILPSERKTPQVANQSEVKNTSRYIDATAAFITGDLEGAEKEYLTVLEKNPDEDAAMYQLARIYQQNANIADAEKYALMAYEQDEQNIWYLKLLSEIYQQKRDYAEAAKMVEKMVALEPGNTENYWILGNLLIFSEQYSDAVKAFNDMEAIIGVSEEVSTRKIKIYEHLKKDEKVLDEIRALITAFPDEVRYRAMLAEKLMAYGKTDDAYEQYRYIAEKNPDDPYIHITLSEYYRKKGEKEKAFSELKTGFGNPQLDIDTKIQVLIGYYSVSEIYDDLNPEAYELLQILVEVHPDNPKAWSMYGDFLYRDDRKKEAADAFFKVLEFDKSKYVVWETLMHALLANSDYERLETTAEEASELFPNQPMPLLFSGFCYLNSKSYANAVRVLKQGAGMVVDNPLLKGQFYSSLGDAYYAQKQKDLAFEAYDKSLLLDPENSYVLNNYSYYLSLEKKDLEKAEIMAQKAVTMDPENPNNLDTYGWVLYQLGKYEQAQEYIYKSMRMRAYPDPEIFEHYGDVMYRLGDKNSAKEYWNKAVDAGGKEPALLKKSETGEIEDE